MDHRIRCRQVQAEFAILVAAHLWAWATSHDRSTLLGTALPAWVFGLRHAVDADHIATIDNVVRKLMQQSREGWPLEFKSRLPMRALSGAA